MAISAADVKRLRDETDAPMMECKGALEEAGGDYERAKAILREKGKAAAVKRADRSTSAGRIEFSTSSNHQAIGGVVLECETDFVANNERFVALAKELSEIYLHNDPGSDANAVKHGDKNVGEIVEGAVAVIRENIRVSKAIHMTSVDNSYASYVHHDGTKGAIVELAGTPANGHDVGRKVAIQVVAYPGAEYITKDQIPAATLQQMLDEQTKRAMDEGKPENVAKNIAQGRVNKEYMQSAVLCEMPFYADATKTVGQYLKEESDKAGNEIKVVGFTRVQVGQ